MQSLADIPIQPGQVIEGKYRVERVLGQGGMGIVVQATHLVLDELVAIKFLLPTVANNEEVVIRFIREAKAAIKIRSEHVARVMDVSTTEARIPYLVMEFLNGRDLSVLLEQHGPLAPRDAVGYLLQACEALGEAHAQGIVHRDLKPANLFVTTRADGAACVKVLDFGISKVAIGGEDSSLTRTQGVMGSPLYMSPEQARSARDSDARSDIWSMGIVLYELLTGTTPFDGETLMQLCVNLIEKQPSPPSALRADLPAGLDDVVMKCIAKDPAHRYANMAELALALAPFGAAGAWESARVTARVLGVNPMAEAERIIEMPSPGPAPPPLEFATSGLQGPTGSNTRSAETVGSWGSTRGGAKPKSRAPLVLAIAASGLVALILFAGASVLWWRTTASPTEGSPVVAASDSQQSAAPSDVLPPEPPTDTSEPPPAASSSAPAVASSAPLAATAPPATTAKAPPTTTPKTPPVKPPVRPPSTTTGPPTPRNDLDLFRDNK